MADKAKMLLIVLIVLMVVSLGLAGVLFVSLQKEQISRAALQEELNTVTAAKKSAELKIEESKKKVAELENKVIENNTQIETLNKELLQQKTEKEDALAEILQMKENLEQQKTLRSLLQDQVAAAQGDAKKMQEELNKLKALKAGLEDKIKDLEKSSEYVELGKIIVTPETPSLFGTPIPETVEETVKVKEGANAAVAKDTVSSGVGSAAKEQPAGSSKLPAEKAKKDHLPSGADGKVLVVNRDYNFVVINLGSKDGVGIGNEFSIYRNDKYIGVVKVEKVHDSMAAAGFGPNDLKDKINEGDKVVRKK